MSMSSLADKMKASNSGFRRPRPEHQRLQFTPSRLTVEQPQNRPSLAIAVIRFARRDGSCRCACHASTETSRQAHEAHNPVLIRREPPRKIVCDFLDSPQSSFIASLISKPPMGKRSDWVEGPHRAPAIRDRWHTTEALLRQTTAAKSLARYTQRSSTCFTSQAIAGTRTSGRQTTSDLEYDVLEAPKPNERSSPVTKYSWSKQ